VCVTVGGVTVLRGFCQPMGLGVVLVLEVVGLGVVIGGVVRSIVGGLSVCLGSLALLILINWSRVSEVILDFSLWFLHASILALKCSDLVKMSPEFSPSNCP
jgi:hypothetical protein